MVEQLTLFDLDEVPIVEPKKSFDEDEYQSIVLTSNVIQDEYTKYIEEAFDLHVSDTSKVCVPMKLNLDYLNDWNIGVICGASGSGKSTILRSLSSRYRGGYCEPSFDENKCLISNFNNMTPQESTLLLSQIGLASVPTWIRPYRVLSNGEQYRARLAKQIADSKDGEIIFVDEYTSVVDRNVAKAMSNALQKYIRKHNKRIILATCHYDVFDWLKPDWIYDLNKGGALEKGDYLRRPRPQIELQVFRTTCDTWQRFKKHHYMTSELNEAATCFCFTWEDKLVAFVAVLPLPSGTLSKGFRGHRAVVLPDYQGLGIGRHITDFIAAIYSNEGCKYYGKTVNPALGLYMETSYKWQATSHNGRALTEQEMNRAFKALHRPSYCYKYIGEAISGYEDLLLPIDKIKYNKSMVGQLTFDI